ncbi:transglutaminase family protein [Azohydromonas sediminis]|uniref:transglutaminase family protein n=1 Tax=Azohydromonas sediminis TaxID=2259674 RepID=UPI003AF37B78
MRVSERSNVPAVLDVEHETVYRYSAPVDWAHHQAFLRPREDRGQQLLHFALDITPPPLRLTEELDRFGNTRHSFTAAGAHRELRVRAASRVRVEPPAAMPPEDTPPWERLRERLTYRAGCRFEAATEFAVPSPYVPRFEPLRAYALRSFAPQRPAAAAAIELMQRLHADFAYVSASTTVDTPLEAVWQSRRGVCQDFAHLLIGALRMLGLAARYVSGYLLTQPPPGQAPLVGADASHAWVALWCPRGDGTGDGTGDGDGDWLELDPTNACLPASDHVRVAIGRDYGDVTPLRGVIRGGGTHQLAVHVTTRRVADDAAPPVAPKWGTQVA